PVRWRARRAAGHRRGLVPVAMAEEITGIAAGTLVRMKEGTKPIEEVRVGDWVLSYPHDQDPPKRLREDGEYVYHQVTAVFVHDEQPVCEVIAWDLGNNIKEPIKVTPNHPLYIKDAGWLGGASLKFGNVLIDADFANLMIKKSRGDAPAPTRVHDLAVDG